MNQFFYFYWLVLVFKTSLNRCHVGDSYGTAYCWGIPKVAMPRLCSAGFPRAVALHQLEKKRLMGLAPVLKTYGSLAWGFGKKSSV